MIDPQSSPPAPSRRRTPLYVASLVVALVLGVGLGAASFSSLHDQTTTVVREVTVGDGTQSAATSATPIGRVYDRASKGVVEIKASAGDGSAQGSGFVYDQHGHVVTNQHVVAGASSFSVSTWNGATYTAKLVGSDPSTDLAVLQIDARPSTLFPLSLADSDLVSVGDPVLALGSPFGLEGTLTTGIVSALHREMTAPNQFTIGDTIQTDAAINHGNSGGPLLDASGRVIGVNAQIESESGGSDGVGFAIPSNTVRSIVDQLIADGVVRHAYLGIRMQTVANGVAVSSVQPATPAASAGLQAATATELRDGIRVPVGGDVIVAFDGTRVTSSEQMQSLVDSKRPGDEVTITVLRDGNRKDVKVKLDVRP
jgi:putative serine protease PepD